MERATLTVGPAAGADIIGADSRALQAAVDYVAGLGGGVVRILPGTYTMYDSLQLRSGVAVIGSGTKTVLRKADAIVSPLYLDGDYGEEEITLVDASGFAPGMGVTILDQRAAGFHVTVARIKAKDGNVLQIDWPLQADYLVSAGALAQTTFPVISGYFLQGARVENLTIDGNKAANPELTGCRGAGIFLYRAKGCAIRNCLVRDFNGDGISFQQSDDITIEGCQCLGNTQLGIHPGSGSQRPVVRGCRMEGNGRIGLFLCWRVKHGLFEDNEIIGNGQVGISIGHKDTDNVFRRCLVQGNGRYGIHFREELEPMSGHRNSFEDCTVEANGTAQEGAGLCIEGHTRGTLLRRCLVRGHKWGIALGPNAERPALEEVRFEANSAGDVISLSEAAR